MHKDWKKICASFLEATSYSPAELEEMSAHRGYDRANRPEQYLTYPDAEVRVPLGTPEFPADCDFWQVLSERRSKRNFKPEPLRLNQLNCLLWAAQGITADMGDYQLRTAPSAGALYPVETYMVVNRVEGLAPGLYHLDVQGWSLEGLRLGDLSEEISEALLGQDMCQLAAVNFVWSAVMERCRAKYYERAYRYVWWDSAHISENLFLAATALGLGSCCIGAWHDNLIHDLLGIDGKEHFSVLAASAGLIDGGDWRQDRRPPKRTD